jgi:hypothetical protein
LSEGLLVILLVVGGVLYWRHRRDQDWGYLYELQTGLADAAEKVREQSAEAEASGLERLADNVQDGYSAVVNKRVLHADRFREIYRDILQCTGDDVLSRAKVSNMTGRRDRTREALFNLAKRLDKLKA